jgi:hypothetical protein
MILMLAVYVKQNLKFGPKMIFGWVGGVEYIEICQYQTVVLNLILTLLFT